MTTTTELTPASPGLKKLSLSLEKLDTIQPKKEYLNSSMKNLSSRNHRIPLMSDRKQSYMGSTLNIDNKKYFVDQLKTTKAQI